MTSSCIRSVFETQIVRRTNRLSRVRTLMCLRSMLCRCSLPRVCLHRVGHTKAWITNPRLDQNAWKIPLSRAIRNAKTLRKPSRFQRMPARLKRL
jgi:hypothetical protein